MSPNILHVVNNHALGGGIGTVISYLDQELNASGEVHSSVLKTRADEFGRNGYETLENEGNINEHIYSSSHLEQELSRHNIIHVHGVPSYRILEAIDSLKREGKGPKIVNTCHSSVKKELEAYLKSTEDEHDVNELKTMVRGGILTAPGRFNGTFWGSAIYRQERIMTEAGVVQHMNDSYLNDIVKEYNAENNRHKHCVVYNGIKVLADEFITPRPKKKRILYSGRFAVEKGIDEFIEALPEVFSAHPNAEVKLMGGDLDGIVVEKYNQKLLGLMKAKFGEEKAETLLGRVIFTGWVSDPQEIHENYEWCDFLIMPSKDESFCLAIAEALNHQRIPIMTNTNSLNELYLSHGIGFGISPPERNGHGIAKVINSVLSNTNQAGLDFMARKGRELVSSKYSLEQVLQQQLEVYRGMIT